MQGDAEFLVGFEQFRIDFVQALGPVLKAFRGRIIGHRLEVDRREVHMRPAGFSHALPRAEGFQPPVEQPLGLAFLGGDETDHLLAQAGRDRLGFDGGDEARLVILADQFMDLFAHLRSSVIPARKLWRFSLRSLQR